MLRYFPFLAAAFAPAASALTIDGTADEPAWREARVFKDFVSTEPLTGEPARLSQEARLLALPEGLAVAFHIEHPSSIPRSKPQTLRDQPGNADRVNFMVDFDGNGRGAYEFTITLANGIEDGTISEETRFNTDWDAEWQHAVHESKNGWDVEILLPWSISAMQKRDGDTRTIGVYFDRVLTATGERFAYPAASYKLPRFVSDFKKIEVPQYETSETRVFPYVSLLSDRVKDEEKLRAGVDVFWKPSSDFQLTATLNPDFGQVESDDLVVDFSAIETFYSDKRPFFTENQGPFELRTPDDGVLIYTRRIGGPADDGGGAADIDAALKLNGSVGGFDYAYLGASERDYRDDKGRAFQALRGRWSDSERSYGYLVTDTDHPFLERHASVQAVDFDQRFGERWRILGQAIASDIHDKSGHARDTGGWTSVQYHPGPRWQHELELLHFGDALDFNDLGYLKRPSLNRLRAESVYHANDFPDDALESGVDYTLEAYYQSNDRGERLPGRIRIDRSSHLRSGGTTDIELLHDDAGVDDRISRGHGLVHQAVRDSFYANAESSRFGNWIVYAGIWRYQEGLSRPFWQLETAARYYFSDRLNVRVGFNPRWSQDWLVWNQDSEFARYRRRQYNGSLELNWFPAARHELRLKTQWLAIDTDGGRLYQLENQRLHATGAPAENFTINTFGFQLRYRYAIAPLSDLFVVYSRGGYAQTYDSQEGAAALLDDARGLRDSDQVFVKLRYRL